MTEANLTNIHVLFFGAVADSVGERETELRITNGARLSSVVDHLKSQYPALLSHQLLAAVNQEYATMDRVIFKGDELALFTAVSGG